MVTYQSTFKGSPPYSEALRAQAQRALSGASPFTEYRGNAADVFRSAASRAMAGVDTTGAAANAAYAQRFNDAQRQLALSGLRTMSDGSRSAQEVASARLSGVNSLLGGLFS